jgi:hypothetical protein
MANKTTTTTTTTTPESAVDALIRQAGEAGATMYAKAREAAKLAAAELPKGKPIADAVAAVVALHKTAFAAAGHNVKAIFTDALWLLAAPAAETVEIKVAGTPDNKPHNVKAADAVEQPKHAMRAAAAQVRELHGASRAKGGGRKAAAILPVNASAQAAIDNATFFAELTRRIADPADLAKIVAALETAGYTVSKKGKTVKSAQQTSQAAAPSLGAQLKAA